MLEFLATTGKAAAIGTGFVQGEMRDVFDHMSAGKDVDVRARRCLGIDDLAERPARVWSGTFHIRSLSIW